jgi:hypothetical protein
MPPASHCSRDSCAVLVTTSPGFRSGVTNLATRIVCNVCHHVEHERLSCDRAAMVGCADTSEDQPTYARQPRHDHQRVAGNDGFESSLCVFASRVRDEGLRCIAHACARTQPRRCLQEPARSHVALPSACPVNVWYAYVESVQSSHCERAGKGTRTAAAARCMARRALDIDPDYNSEEDSDYVPSGGHLALERRVRGCGVALSQLAASVCARVSQRATRRAPPA